MSARCPPKGAALRAHGTARVDDAQSAGSALSPRPRVMFPLSAQGGPPVIGEACTSAEATIRLAGGVSAVTGVEGCTRLTGEAAVSAAPDVILMMDRGGEHAVTRADIAVHPAPLPTPAGAARRGVTLDGLYLPGFGPRAGDAAWEPTARLREVTAGTRG